MAGDEYNQVRPKQAQNRDKIAAGSPLAVLGLLLEALRERFAEGNGLEVVWRDDPALTDILIEIGYNVEVESRNYGRALYLNRLSSSPRAIAVGDRAGVRLRDHYEGFIAEMTSQLTIDCVSNDKGDSMLLGDVTQHFLLAVRQIMESQYGIHDFGMPELGQTSPFEHDQEKWSTSVSFTLSYFVRWATVKIRPLLQQIAVTTQDAQEASANVALASINRGAPIALTQSAASTPTAPSLRTYSSLVGDGVQLQYDLEHGLGTTQVLVSVFRESDGAEVPCTLYRPTANTIRLIFTAPPSQDQFRAVVVG